MTSGDTGQGLLGPDPGSEPWQRLDPRTAPASAGMAFGSLIGVGIPVAIGMLLSGVGPGWVALWVVGGVLVLTGLLWLFEIVRVRASRYRLRADRIDLRVSLFASRTQSLPLRRVRAVDLTADLVQRRLGLVTVRLGTGDQSGSRFQLAAVDRVTAEQLRTAILGERSDPAGERTGRLATFDPSWLRYAPISLGTPLIGVAALGAVLQVADWFHAVPRLVAVVNDSLQAVPIPVRILILFLLAVLIGVVGSLIFFVEAWWGYRLDRDPDGTLHLQRGLVVRRSSSYQGARIRGVTLDEPIGYRRVGAAKLHVVAVGLDTQREDGSKNQESTTIVPAAPRPAVLGVAAAILGHELPGRLQPHPPAAARRRYVWSGLILLLVLVLLALPVLLGATLSSGDTASGWRQLWWLVGGLAVVGIPITYWLARDNIRGLGHLITAEHVVLRSGSVFRRTAVLQRTGVLGWNLRRSPGQRRSGLATLVATSAASPGSFRLPDIGLDDVQGLQAAAGPVWERLWQSDTADSPEVSES